MTGIAEHAGADPAAAPITLNKLRHNYIEFLCLCQVLC